MPTDENVEYTDDFVRTLEAIFGTGFLSPGSAEEVAKIIEGIELADKEVLDIGVGLGGPTCLLVENYNARHVTAVDIEAPVLAKATKTVERFGLSDRITIKKIDPGPLPFADSSFDVVFSKDSIIHISDKQMLFADVYRVLRPGGWLAMSDWCCDDKPFTPEMTEWTEGTGLSFAMQPLKNYKSLLSEAGFVEVSTADRNAWFTDFSNALAKRLKSEGYGTLVEKLGRDDADWQVNRAELRAVIAAQGQLRPGHIRGRKPS